MEYLHEKEISAEEFWLLYRIMVQEPNNKGGHIKVTTLDKNQGFKNFAMWSKIYNDRATIGKKKVDWVSVAVDLEERGFLEIWSRKDDSIQLADIKVTDKFRKHFVVNSVEEALNELIEIYPKMVRITRDSKKYPAINQPLPVLAKKYDELILKGGNIYNHWRCMAITQRYLDDLDSNSAPMGLDKYFEQFDGIAIAYEKGGEGKTQTDETYNDL